MNLLPIVLLCTFMLAYGIVSAIRTEIHPLRWGEDGWLTFIAIVVGITLNAAMVISAVSK